MFQKADLKKPRPFQLKQDLSIPASFYEDLKVDRYNTINVELGAGRGDWSLSQAKQDPQSLYVAIERTHNKSQIMLKQYQDAGLSNLVGVQADGILLLASRFPKNSVDHIDILYPNPTPKKKQANQRFVVGSAFHVIDQVLKPGGKVIIASNINEYIQEAYDFLVQVWVYQAESIDALPKDFVARTAFERKYQERGQMLYQVVAKKP